MRVVFFCGVFWRLNNRRGAMNAMNRAPFNEEFSSVMGRSLTRVIQGKSPPPTPTIPLLCQNDPIVFALSTANPNRMIPSTR